MLKLKQTWRMYKFAPPSQLTEWGMYAPENETPPPRLGSPARRCTNAASMSSSRTIVCWGTLESASSCQTHSQIREIMAISQKSLYVSHSSVCTLQLMATMRTSRSSVSPSEFRDSMHMSNERCPASAKMNDDFPHPGGPCSR